MSQQALSVNRFVPGLVLGGALVLFGAGSALAADQPIQEELSQIKQRLSTLESGLGEAGAKEAGASWLDRVTLSGLVEVEAGVVNDNDDSNTESDIAVAAVEFGVDAKVSDYSSARFLLLYEDDPGTFDIDEATVTLGNPDKFPLYLTAGKMYVPFGFYESQMISDPFTLELGETNEGAVKVGLDVVGVRASVYTFNGDTSNGGDDTVDHYGASLGYGMEREGFRLDLGGDWISSIRDSDGLFVPAVQDDTNDQGVNDYVAGAAAHLVIGAGPLTLIGEYVAALDDLNGPDSNSEVRAFNVEVGLTFLLGSMETVLAVAYQKTYEAEGLLAELAEKRVMTSLSLEILPETVLAFEWMNEKDYEVNGGLDWDVYTLQLAVNF